MKFSSYVKTFNGNQFNDKQFVATTIRGRIVGPADVNSSIMDLLSIEIDGVQPEKIYSNEVIWNFKENRIKVRIYYRFALLEEEIDVKDQKIWILRKVASIGSDFKDYVEKEKVKNIILKIRKEKQKDLKNKIDLDNLSKKIEKGIKDSLIPIWFLIKDTKIKDLGPNRKIIYTPLAGSGVGHIGFIGGRIYQFFTDLYIDHNNLLKVSQGGVEGDADGGTWELGVSDLNCYFAPWQKEEEIVNCISNFTNRF